MDQQTKGRKEMRRIGTSFMRRSRLATAGTVALVAAATVLLAPGQAQAATLWVNCGTGGNLQSKIDAAPSGSTILLKGTCVGNFQITGKGLTIKGNPTATLDGNFAGKTLFIDAAGKTVRLVGLTVSKGRAATEGGGIHKTAGNLVLERVTVTGNAALPGAYSYVQGGGILSNDGDLTLVSSTVSSNSASSSGIAHAAYGGGIAAYNGDLTIRASVISLNTAHGAPSSGNHEAGNAIGGGLFLSSGNLTVQGSTLSGNRAAAEGDGSHWGASAAGSAAMAHGGVVSMTDTIVKGNFSSAASTTYDSTASAALYFMYSATTLARSRVFTNTAEAKTSVGKARVYGGGVRVFDAPLKVTASRISGNVAKATGPTAEAFGGALHAKTSTLTKTSVDRNKVTASASTGMAFAQGGGVYADTKLTSAASTVSRNTASATMTAADFARAIAGGIYSPIVRVTNSTVALNKLSATSPAAGGTSNAWGAGIAAASGPSTLLNTTVAGNTTAASGAIVSRLAGGLYATSNLTLRATILANNTASIGPDCAGGPVSAGHNLIRTSAGCSFTRKGSDRLGKAPRLGSLRSNGGPTQTMAVRPASPARNAVAGAACTVRRDQRGLRRPQGGRCDIGAYERRVG
jgi:hypothetical protein